MKQKRKKGMSLASKILNQATVLIKKSVNKQTKVEKGKKGKLHVTKRQIKGASYLSGLRDKSPSESLHDLRNILAIKSLRNNIIPYSFPKNVEIKESVRYKDSIHGLHFDLEFETIILNSFGEEISVFLSLKQKFDEFILKSDLSKASVVLDEVFTLFGYSNWYISSKLNLIVERGDSKEFLDCHKQVTEEFRINQYNNLSEVHLSYPFIRCDKGVSYERYTFAIQHQSEEFKLSRNSSSIEQIDFAHCYSPEKKYEFLSKIICEHSSHNIIDRYLNFRRIISSCHLHNKLDGFNFSTIEILYQNTHDELLKNILYLNEFMDFSCDVNDKEIANICSLYFKGDYESTSKLCEELIDRKPTGTTVVDIYVKSLIRINKRPERGDLINNIINSIIDLYICDNKSETIKVLSKDFLRFYHCDWSYFIKLQCEKFLVIYDGKQIDFIYRFLELNHSLANIFSRGEYIGNDNLNVVNKESLLLDSEDIKRNDDIEKGRKLKVLGDDFYTKAEYGIAYIYYEKLSIIDDVLYKDHALSQLALCLFRQGKLNDAFNLISNLIKVSSNSIYPCIKEVSLEIITSDNSSSGLSQLIDRAIILNTFNAFKNKNYSYILTLICEDILERLGVFSSDDIKVDIHNYFLFEKVFTFDVMETFDIFESKNEILLFRFVILQKLVNFKNLKMKEGDVDSLKAEMFRTLEKLVKEICIIDCGSGRIEVDTISVKTNANTKFLNEFDTLRKSEKIPFKESDYTQLRKDTNLYEYSTNAFYAKTLELFYKIRDEYTISPLYGLDNFLNLNIRHGGIINLLLGPIKTHKIFYLKNDKGIYERENYWFEQYVYLNKENRELIDDALRSFSRSIDKEVQMAKGWIHINTGEFSESEKVFNFLVNPSVIEELGKRAAEGVGFENFVNLVIDFLINETNNALEEIKKRLDIILRKNLDNCFDTLFSDIKKISRLDELKRKIRLSQREVNEKVSELMTWMNWKNETNNPFLIGSSVSAAKDMAKTLYPNVEIKIISEDNARVAIKGDFFRRFVTVFLILIDNAVNHSRIKDVINLSIIVGSSEDDNITIFFQNEFNPSAYDEIYNKIMKILPEINNNYIEGANGESGSGLFKIKKLFSYDMRINNHLDISLDSTLFMFNFIVTLKKVELYEL